MFSFTYSFYSSERSFFEQNRYDKVTKIKRKLEATAKLNDANYFSLENEKSTELF
jgi:uridine phosphorylase